MTLRPMMLISMTLLVACGDKDDDGGGDGDSGGTDGGVVDADGDGFAVEDDCDDTNADVNPDADEICDGIDNDCDTLVDDEDDSVDLSTGTTFYADADGDGYGDPAVAVDACAAPSGTVESSDDCDDTLAGVNPGAVEVCDAADLDENCSGAADDADPDVDASTQTLTFPDGDSDGFGDADDPGTLYCDPPSGVVTDNTDCDDGDGDVHPDATEICDADDVDEDCAGGADDADVNVDPATQTLGYPDTDGDGYGNADVGGVLYCDFPSDVVADNTDCDDLEFNVNPGVTEVCDADNIDEDCSGAADNGDPDVDPSTLSTFYADADGDRYGDPDVEVLACDEPPTAVTDNTDCDDTNANTYPGATELCDGEDNDCDTDDSDIGLVSFESSAGVWTSLTSSFNGGSMTNAVGWTSPEAGTLWFCNDTFFTNLDLEHDVNVYGLSGDEVLDGAEAGSVVNIETDAITVSIQDLTIQNGSADGAMLATLGYTASGGGIHCDSTADLNLDGVTLLDNDAAQLGGGLAAHTCTVDIVDGVLEDNTAYFGAGLFLYEASLTVTDALIDANTADADGGGLMVVDSDAELESTLVSNNVALSEAGGAYVQNFYSTASLSCTGTAATAAGFLDNEADGDGGGVNLRYSADFEADSCDFGTLTGGDENTTYGLYNGADGYVFGYGDDATFSCTGGSCGTSTTEDLGRSVSNNYDGNNRYRGNMFLGTDYGTIDRFAVDLVGDSSCLFDHYIASNSTLGTSGWTIEWSSLDHSPQSDGSVADTEDIGLAMEVGTYYAVFTGWNCSTTGHEADYSSSPSQHNDIPLGLHVGYVVNNAYTTALSGTGVTLSAFTSTTQYYGTIDVTEL